MQESQPKPVALEKRSLRTVVLTLITALTLCVPVLPACFPIIVIDDDILAPSAPPPIRVETRTRKPGPRHVWVQGRWQWSARVGRYIWSPGTWKRIRHPHHRHWVQGRWVKTPDGWKWSRGHWH